MSARAEVVSGIVEDFYSDENRERFLEQLDMALTADGVVMSVYNGQDAIY